MAGFTWTKVRVSPLPDDQRAMQYRSEGWRPISPKRARKLRRRGESVIWIPEFCSDAWKPHHLRDEEAP